MNKTRNICVVTGTRAEYGLLKPLMLGITCQPDFELTTVVTGMHLSDTFGNTWRRISEDGLPITAKVPILQETLDHTKEDNLPSHITSVETAAAISGISQEFSLRRPDLVVLLGDRYETFGAAVAATFHNIPIAHLHGGELTEGAFDDVLRHAISKMSHFHFTSTEAYRKRVIQMGESPERVFCVGAFGLDAIANTKQIPKDILESELGIQFGEKSVIVTYHPVTRSTDQSANQFGTLLRALEKIPGLHVIITFPNSDPGSKPIRDLISEFCNGNPGRFFSFKSLGSARYLSTLNVVNGVVGNSSSGIIEAPSFGIGTVNIGIRQKGRVTGPTVVHCGTTLDEIEEAVRFVISDEFRTQIIGAQNPYGTPGAAERTLKILTTLEFKSELQKPFFDIPLNIVDKKND